MLCLTVVWFTGPAAGWISLSVSLWLHCTYYYLLKRVVFSQVKFANTTFKTDVYPKSLNPQWNSEWFKFEVSFVFTDKRLYPTGKRQALTPLFACFLCRWMMKTCRMSHCRSQSLTTIHTVPMTQLERSTSTLTLCCTLRQPPLSLDGFPFMTPYMVRKDSVLNKQNWVKLNIYVTNETLYYAQSVQRN